MKLFLQLAAWDRQPLEARTSPIETAACMVLGGLCLIVFAACLMAARGACQ